MASNDNAEKDLSANKGSNKWKEDGWMTKGVNGKVREGEEGM